MNTTVPPRIAAALLLANSLFATSSIFGAQDAARGEFFTQQIQPLLKEYCLTCHSTEKQKGDLDLESLSTIEAVRKHPKVWQRVAEQLADNEMPPKKKPQPAPEEKERLSKWVAALLDDLARERAGDPGPVVLRRLSNAEYTYTLRDLTGVESLQPAREFPVDGAAGEGFTNTGQALVMSPALITKYLDAAKEIASHAVLLPDGIRFSSKTTQRDWTEEILAQIRGFYRQFTVPRSREKLTLQGVPLDTNDGGSLPLETYLAASIEQRDGLTHEHGLSAKYLAMLNAALTDTEPSMLLDGIRARWRTAKPGEAAALAAEIAPWQKALWKFSSVGHIGRVGGSKAWMEPVNPLTPKLEVRLKIPAPQDGKEVALYLVASDAGDGSESDSVVWQRPRLVAPGRPDLLLRDVPAVSAELGRRRERIFGSAAKCLVASTEAQGGGDVAEIARRHGVEPEALGAWLDYLGIGAGGPVTVDSHFTAKMESGAGHDFIKGWGTPETPSLVANSSDQHVRIPGDMKPHSIAVHPSPKLKAAVGWRSPVAATMRVEAQVAHAHPGCGNGVAWSLELRRGSTRQALGSGVLGVAQATKVGPIETLAVQPGDLVSLLIGARDGDHSCDLTAIDLTLTSSGEGAQTWNLAKETSPDVLAANPHSDRFGHEGVWHFYTEPDSGTLGTMIPAGSLLARWQSASSAEEKKALAEEVQKLLLTGAPAAKESPDTRLYQELTSIGGPLFRGAKSRIENLESADIAMRAPAVLEVRIPAALAAGCEFVTTGTLDPATGAEGSVQLQVLTTKPERAPGLLPSSTTVTNAAVVLLANNQRVSHSMPIVVNDGSAARRRIESAFEAFRQLFPAALCYTKIVPVDEVVTLTLFHREDEHLARLMLDEAQKAKLDRLWDELHYISHDALTLVDAFAQLLEYASQDGDPKQFEPMRGSINDRAAAFRKRLIATEPKHVDAVLEFASRAYRRPLTESERGELRGLYQKLRAQELAHDDAIRLTLARVLVAPAFLYRAESPGPGLVQTPLNDGELANRLSYFLWSSMPDAELRKVAADGKLRDPEALVAQTRRMLADERVRRLSIEFACQWLHIRDFDALDEKSERHFPTFGELRAPMYEESIRFFMDFFQHDGSVLSILDADHTFLNEALAKHYGIPGVTGDQWRRFEGLKQFSRGGILGQGAPLAKQSGASRTSPILRGNWVAEVLLGDKLPKPPKDVPQLPEDEATETLTVRQLTEKHTSDPRCYGCHQRIDAFGFALESFDAIGRHRDRDLGGRPIDTRSKVIDGTEIEGIAGLRDYLVTKRRDAFLRQFCRKLLGYALGRGLLLSDEPLLTEMRAQLQAKDYHVSVAIEAIVRSRQFLDIRGREMAYED